MNSTRKLARTIGILYVLISIPGIFGLLYVPSVLIVRGDAAATARKILASETLFRAGIVADLLAQAAFILVALALYRLLKGVDRNLAALMVILLVVQIPLAFAAEVHRLAVLNLLDGASPASAFGEAQRNAQMMMSLDSFSDGMLVTEIFMGLWLFPLGVLIWRSGFLPRFLGLLLFVAALAYFAEAVTWLLLPAYGHAVGKIAGKLRPLELVTPLWMLIMGARDRPLVD
ncbi:MAG TPA: DUF4386 domain-containing protein [Thermoanaerobaculia bacterium]|nr:DUF4386 domain-containing protein [Thermoanaerobaculia bacterium]